LGCDKKAEKVILLKQLSNYHLLTLPLSWVPYLDQFALKGMKGDDQLHKFPLTFKGN